MPQDEDNPVILESDQNPPVANGVQVFSEDASVPEFPSLDELHAKMVRKIASMLDSSNPEMVATAVQVVQQLRQEEDYRVQREQQEAFQKKYQEAILNGEISPQQAPGLGMPMMGMFGMAAMPTDDVSDPEETDSPVKEKRSSSRSVTEE